MRSLRPFVLGAATAAFAASALFLAVPSLGGPGSERTRFVAHHHSFLARSATATRSAGGGIAGIRDLEFKGQAPPGKEDGVHFNCPRKTPHAISAYFAPEKPEQAGMVQLADSFPSGKGNRSWDVGVFNPTAQPQAYFAGVVCVK